MRLNRAGTTRLKNKTALGNGVCRMSTRKMSGHQGLHAMRQQASAAPGIKPNGVEAAGLGEAAGPGEAGGLEPDSFMASGIEPSHLDVWKRESHEDRGAAAVGNSEFGNSQSANAGAKAERPQPVSRVAQSAMLAIRFYQRCVSPFTPPSCRFYPSCSHYAYGSIQRFGLWRGGWMGLKRICKCHPFHPGGYDPVPELEASTRQTSTRETSARSEPPENRHLI
jgi:putative membrane protein insertion efficiency factor